MAQKREKRSTRLTLRRHVADRSTKKAEKASVFWHNEGAARWHGRQAVAQEVKVASCLSFHGKESRESALRRSYFAQKMATGSSVRRLQNERGGRNTPTNRPTEVVKTCERPYCFAFRAAVHVASLSAMRAAEETDSHKPKRTHRRRGPRRTRIGRLMWDGTWRSDGSHRNANDR